MNSKKRLHPNGPPSAVSPLDQSASPPAKVPAGPEAAELGAVFGSLTALVLLIVTMVSRC